MKYRIVQGGIVNQQADAIVNAWNRNFFPWWLLIPQGVSKAIRKAAGNQPFKELAKISVLKTGEAVYTSPGQLPFRYIIHVAGINAFWLSTPYSISESVKNAVSLAEKLKLQKIAMPLIGAGTGNTNDEKCLEIITRTLDTLHSDIEIIIVQYSSK